MKKDYTAQFADENMEQILLNKDNIPVLEELLHEESKHLVRLRELKEDGKLDFGPILTKKEVKNLFPQIKKEVNEFLDVNCEAPAIKHYSLVVTMHERCNFGSFHRYESMFNPRTYLYKYGKIRLRSKKERPVIIPVISHEYSHSIGYQKYDKINILSHGCFIEGFALGVERYIAKLYRNNEDNEAFLYYTIDKTVEHLKSSYIWMSKILGIVPKDFLLDIKSLTEIEEEKWKKDKIVYEIREVSEHAIGNALFYIYETSRGNQIYKEMINGRFRF